MSNTTSDKNHKYLQLARHFTEQIRSGQLQPGDKLPSFAQMHEQFGATVATVERLYAHLDREHLIERRHRSGVYVAAWQRPALLNGTLGFLAAAGAARSHPYYYQLQLGIQRAASEAGVLILLLSEDGLQANRSKIDGLLVMESQIAESVGRFMRTLPSVSLLTGVPGLGSVVADDRAGTRSATEHLLALGHRRIACLMGNAPGDLVLDHYSPLRLEGYRAVLEQAGIRASPNWLRPVPYNPLLDYRGRGHEAMTRWLRQGWANLGCTAILTQNDDTAVGVIEALREAGLEVPHDVSVVGFDGAGADKYFVPRLSTVEVPLEEIGARGTEMLLRNIREAAAPQALTLPTRFRAGDSTAISPSGPGSTGA